MSNPTESIPGGTDMGSKFVEENIPSTTEAHRYHLSHVIFLQSHATLFMICVCKKKRLLTPENIFA